MSNVARICIPGLLSCGLLAAQFATVAEVSDEDPKTADGEGHAADLLTPRAELTKRVVTLNQLVGFNLRWFRLAAGLTQEELGRRLGGWSKGVVSAAERSWDSDRVRQFDGDEIVQIATVLGVPIIAMFLPPPDAGTAVDYVFDLGAQAPIDLATLLAHIAPPYRQEDTPAAVAYRERLIALGPVAVADHPLSAEVLTRAWREADATLIKARRNAEQFTGDARSRAEALERDAQERYSAAMARLIPTYEALERRVSDLRDFEREYRVRLIAYLEGQLNDLRAGAADSGAFPPVLKVPPESDPDRKP